ncbi:tetratricopeptide repeat protein [Archaeoglobus sp.]
MEKFIESVANFIDEDDVKVLKAVGSDPITLHSIKKIFDYPEKASKYLILLRDSPVAIYLVAKISERLSRYLEGEDEAKCFAVFLTALRELKGCGDRRVLQNMFLLLKEAIERRLSDGKYEDAAKLVMEFQDFGFKSYIKKILFFALEVSEEGDYRRAMRILDLLPETDAVIDAKASVLLEWGKSLALSNPEAAMKKVEESLKLKDTVDARLAMAEIYENLGNYEKAYFIYTSLRSIYPGIDRKISRMLMEWGEETGDVEKLREAYNLAMGDKLLTEEIERRIKKLEAQRLSGS